MLLYYIIPRFMWQEQRSQMLYVAAVFCDYYNSPDDCEWHYKPCGADCMKTCRNPSGDCSNLTTAMEGRLDRLFGISSSCFVLFLNRVLSATWANWFTKIQILIKCLNMCHSYLLLFSPQAADKKFMAFAKPTNHFMPCLPKAVCPYRIVFWQKSIRIKCFVWRIYDATYNVSSWGTSKSNQIWWRHSKIKFVGTFL